MIRNQPTGYLYSLGSSLALASSFVFSKSALNQLTIIQFGFLWFSLGAVWNAIWFFSRGRYRSVSSSPWRITMVALVIAVFEGAATGLFYLAIEAMDNPAVVSFIGNIGPVFVTILGITLLKERFRNMQLLGVLTTLAGVFVINYRQGGFAGFLDPGSFYVIAASFLFSVATITGRRYHRLLVPEYMSLLRSLILASVMGWLFLERSMVPSLSTAVWRDLVLGSILETLVVIVLAYQALKLIEAARTSLIISSKGVWTLLLAWIFLDVFPSWFQLAGGLLTLLGVWMITWGARPTPQE
jgi:drug/metabolite transporter (DMT)-like permease